MIISSVTTTEVTTKDTLLQNWYTIRHTGFLNQFSNLEFHAFNHFWNLVLYDLDGKQFDNLLRKRHGSIKSLATNYTEVIAGKGGIFPIPDRRHEGYGVLLHHFFEEWSQWRI